MSVGLPTNISRITRITRMPSGPVALGKVRRAVPVSCHAAGRVMSSSMRLAWTGLASQPNSAEFWKSMGEERAR